jgi:phospholipase C
MKIVAGLVVAIGVAAAAPASAHPTSFEHIVVIVQENRTPDNLFYALCATQQCSTKRGAKAYDIQTANWLDKNAKHGTVKPGPIPLANDYDPRHEHFDFVAMCDLDMQTRTCRMDGAGDIKCGKNCPRDAELKYVDNSKGTIEPYLRLATQYGWANYMFQTNQGPSFPAHQFLFGATSAPSLNDDHHGSFVSENLSTQRDVPTQNGCIAPPSARVQLINFAGREDPWNMIYPCLEHLTLADVLGRHKVSWRYYTPGAGSLWSAPDAIRHICEPNAGACVGSLWRSDVDLKPIDVLSDAAACKLRGVSWVIPSAQFSDHAMVNVGGGPAWVADVVNAIGNSSCRNVDGSTYWDSTAIVITWDDWGGWYDHEPPTFLPAPQGGYQYGFRVPMVFVSAYTSAGYISNERLDFGSIARFIERNFGIRAGALTFADARAKGDLASFYNFSLAARTFTTIPAPAFTSLFDVNSMKLEPPDDD